MYHEILATNDAYTSVCRTRVTRFSWKIVSHPRFTCKFKGQTQRVSMVNMGPMSCEVRPGGVKLARHARKASMVNTSPMSCEASYLGVCEYSLWGNVPWRSLVME